MLPFLHPSPFFPLLLAHFLFLFTFSFHSRSWRALYRLSRGKSESTTRDFEEFPPFFSSLHHFTFALFYYPALNLILIILNLVRDWTRKLARHSSKNISHGKYWIFQEISILRYFEIWRLKRFFLNNIRQGEKEHNIIFLEIIRE